jgi:hypothetical protein
MNDPDPFIERLRQFIGRDCRFYGRDCRVVEVLNADARLVLETRDGTPPIQIDQYGQAAYRSNEHIEVALFNAAGDLSEELLHVLDGVKRGG